MAKWIKGIRSVIANLTRKTPDIGPSQPNLIPHNLITRSSIEAHAKPESGTMSKPYVHPESRALLRIIEARPGIHELGGVAEARQMTDRSAELFAGDPEFEGKEREVLIPGPAGDIAVSVYTPRAVEPEPVIVIYFHGGGFVVGSRKSHEVTCKVIARQSRCIVANVEYRLGPEDKIPAAFDDARAVMQWVTRNKQTLGGGVRSKVGVAGDSAGATLAASVCYEVPNIDFQILVYPMVDYTTEFESSKEFAKGYFLTFELGKWFFEQSNNDISTVLNPRYCVLRKTEAEAATLPPALFVVANLDVLRDGCVAYEKKLKESGVYTEFLMVDGAIHGFFTLPGFFKELCREPYGRIEKFINQIKGAAKL